jgi:hypothetical protein
VIYDVFTHGDQGFNSGKFMWLAWWH